MTLGDLMRTRRIERGLSQLDVAEALGVSQQTVSRWEAGEATPRPRRVAEIAAVLGVSPAYLIKAVGASVPVEDQSGSHERLLDVLRTIHLLSDRELVHLIDTAWQEQRTRLGLDEPATAPD